MSVLVKGLQERNQLKMMEELPKFITMDNHEAIKTNNWKKAQESLPAVKPKFISDFLEAVVREGAD